MSAQTHFRRCHMCGEVNSVASTSESGQADHVERCTSCNKPLAPFFYFDEKMVQGYTEAGARVQEDESGKYDPIIGLTAHW